MTKQRYQNEFIWIVGASSGIGLALAQHLAQEGATIILSARNGEALATHAKAMGAQHLAYPLDITDAHATQTAATTLWQRFGRIDRVIFMAAAYTPMNLKEMNLQEASQMVDVNIKGALHLIAAVLPKLKLQHEGQLALCGSVAGYTGLPGGQPYSATKAAIINLAESLYSEAPSHIDVKLISPGFVRTPLTDKNDFTMPMIISPETAALAIADGLKSRRFEIHFPKRFTMMLKLLQHLPYALRLRLAKHTQKGH
jgi:short-subunit dehydrogenase